MYRLQAAGVPAGVVQRSSDLLADPQYAHRGFYRYLDHPVMGRIPYAGHQYRIRGYDNGPRAPAPTLGQHSFEVLSELLGLSDEAIAEAFATGAVA
jgi:crotonobetainyl-CoA:carnitine CoA-transferase CaiB-like acyl-CoA transferase